MGSPTPKPHAETLIAGCVGVNWVHPEGGADRLGSWRAGTLGCSPEWLGCHLSMWSLPLPASHPPPCRRRQVPLASGTPAKAELSIPTHDCGIHALWHPRCFLSPFCCDDPTPQAALRPHFVHPRPSELGTIPPLLHAMYLAMTLRLITLV